MTGISLGNAPWGTNNNLLDVGRIEAKVSLIPLLSGNIQVNNFILHDTSVFLEKNVEGQGNWEFEATQTTEETQDSGDSSLPQISIENVEIQNALVSYRELTDESLIEFRLREFTTSVTGLDSPLSFGMEADYNEVPLAISGTIGSLDSLTSGADFPIDISGNLGELIFNSNGSLANLPDSPSGSIAFALELDSLAEMNSLADSQLPDQGPLKIAGTLSLSGLDEMNIDEINLLLGDLNITGTIEVSTVSEIPQITAILQSDMLDLTPFMGEENKEEVEFLFSRDALPLESLSTINADISHKTSRIVTPSIELTENELTINLNNGNLELVNRAVVAGGNFAAEMTLDALNNNQAKLTTHITGDDIMLEHLPHEQDLWFTGGATNISINGTGSGSTVAEIMGSFNGDILVNIGEATMPNSSIDMFGADIIFSTINKLNPLSSQEDISLLECAVVNLPVNDGMINLDRQIAIQTSKMYMVGSGEINLKNEEINIGVRPYAKEGVGLNLSSIAGAAKIGGTLANPQAEFDAANAVKTGLSAGAAVATGGLSLLAQGLFSKAGTDPEPCNTALGISPQTSSQPSQGTESQATEENIGGGDVVDDVKSTIKGLFGR
jgi:AsmA family protein